jgi:Mce-associated membrane protein
MTTNSTPNPTWYDILGVTRDASPADIKAAWRNATDKFEPGSGASQFRLFNEAADVLLDPERRAEYDAEIDGAEPVEAEPHAAEPVEAEPRVVEPVEAEPEVAEVAPVAAPAGGGFFGALGRVPDLVIALVAALAVASLVLAGYLGIRIHDSVAVADAGPDAAATAERALNDVLSYDYRKMDADRDRAVRYLTSSYKKQYLKTFALLTQGADGTPGGAVKTKAVVTADVLDTGIVDAERNRVRVIAFVNQSSVKGSSQPAIFQNRVVVTMVRHGDDWLIDNIKSY